MALGDFYSDTNKKSSKSTPASGGGLGSFFSDSQSGGKKKKKGSLFGNIKSSLNPVNIGKDLLGTAGELISLPQQLLFSGAHTIGHLATLPGEGNWEDVKAGAKQFGREAISLGQAKGNWDFADTLGRVDKSTGKMTPAKLPTGVNTAGTVILDPANFMTLGTGGVARQGIRQLGKITGLGTQGVRKKIAEEGVESVLGGGGREALESSIRGNLAGTSKKYSRVAAKKGEDAAEKWAGKRAREVSKAVEQRGMGGIGFHIPGTSKTTNIVQGSTLKKGAQAVRKAPIIDEATTGLRTVAGPISDWAARALIPGRELAGKFGSEIAQNVRQLGSARIARQESRIQDLVGELSNAAKTVEESLGRKLTVAEDALILKGMQGGKAVRAEIIEQNPHLAPVMKTAERVREGMTLDQLKAQVLKNVHDTETYARRVITPEAQQALFNNPDQMARLATQVGGNLSGSLVQRSAKARNLFPEMPDSAVNEMIARVHAGEAAGDVINDPKYAQWIGVKQQEKAEAAFQKAVDQIKAQPVTEKSAAAWQAEADDFFKQADERIKAALEEGADEVEIGGNTYLTPKSDLEKTTLYNYISTLKSGQNIDPNYSGMGFGNMLSELEANMLPSDIQIAIAKLKQTDTKFNKKPYFEKVMKFVEENGPEYQAYRQELINRMRAMGYEDEIFVFRGFQPENLPGTSSNVTVSYNVAQIFSQPGTIPRIYRVKLDDLSFGMGGFTHQYENEIVFPTEALRQLHPDELKFLRTKKKVLVPKENSTLSDLEKEVLKAQAEELKKLGQQAQINAGQVVKAGAVTPEQVKAQVAAAFQLAMQNSDTTGLRKILTGQLEYIANTLKPGEKLYEESAMLSLLTKGNEAARAIEAANYVNDLRTIKAPGSNVPILLGAEDYRKLPKTLTGGMVKKEYPIFGDLYADPALHEEMQRVFRYIGEDGAIKQFDDAMSKWERFWKTHATVGLFGSLPFGMRNLRSNGWLMVAGGMAPQEVVSYSKQAMDFQRKIHQIVKKGKYADEVAERGLDAVLRSKLTPQEYKTYREAQKRGVITQGFFDFDFDETAASKLRQLGIDTPKPKMGRARRAARYTLSTQGGLAQRGRQLNSAFEHNSRMAVFMREMDKHGDVGMAADRVKELLFDYSDLTPFEQKRLKKVIPFYTFMRKNVPLQFRTLAENPARIALPEKSRLLYSDPLGEDAPDYQREGGARRIKDWVPYLGGQVTTPDRPFDAAVDVVSPLLLASQGRGKEAAREAANVPSGGILNLLKYGYEQGTGTDLFTGNKISPDEGPLQRFLQNQLPSVTRLPRIEQGGVSPARALTGKQPRPTSNELLKLLTGVRAQRQ